MKKVFVFFLLTMLWTAVDAQETQDRKVGSFSGVKVSEGIDVHLKQGDKESVRVVVTGTKIENVITEVAGSYLKVHMASGNFRGRVDVKVYVTYVKISKLAASSAGNIYADEPLRTDNLEIQCSSAGNVEIAVDAGRVELSASSAGQIELKGKARSLTAEASSAGQIDTYDLEVDAVRADASSGGSVKVSVRSELNANASSGGSVRYRGNPGKSITNSSSGGSVKKSS
jgi:hypothetical protein